MKIEIGYDGRMGVSNTSIFLADHSLAEIVGKALELGDNEFRSINAEIEININIKPDAPAVWIEGEDEC